MMVALGAGALIATAIASCLFFHWWLSGSDGDRP